MLPRVLLVDDEPNLLEGLKRHLRGVYSVDTALGPDEALQMLEKSGPYAVVVSDMRMPGRDGAEFLEIVRVKYPLTVRIMLTGNADQTTAVRAINQGSIFRFLSKPCEKADLLVVLAAAMEQYRLVTAEKDLLQNTLSGSVKVLTDILALIDPESFGELGSLRDAVRKICKQCGIQNAWEIELAVMLQDIGRIMIPASIVAKIKNRRKLTPSESEIVVKIPSISHGLISNIPRLDAIAEIVLYQAKNFDGSGFPEDGKAGTSLPWGARLLRILNEARTGSGLSKEALLALRPGGNLDPEILTIVQDLFRLQRSEEGAAYRVKVRDLVVGQRFLGDVVTADGRLLLTKGGMVTETVIKRLRNYASFVGIQEPLLVDSMIPIAEDSERILQ